jgi:Nitrate and nitrite sensing/Histidine kinase-, DNA gyrase B-, and HSP90-like ATPase
MRTGEDMAQPVQTTTRRSGGAALLAIPLLAVLVLAGIGLAGSLRAGARAERVRGLVPFTGALNTLVRDLQLERSLSAAQPPAGPALGAARVAVDGAAASYRDAAVQVDISDRDRRLHQRLDSGLGRLAELTVLRAVIDGAAQGRGPDPVTVFRRYTAIIGDLLAVGGEIGLHEAGQDAGLLQAVTAATAFSRAKELADRERAAAAQAAASGTLAPAERTRLATLGGRQDAQLDQFTALANPGQQARYARAFPAAEVDQAARLRRAALDAGPGRGGGADLAGWSEATTTRFERMRGVELGLTAEVAALAAQADRAAARRVLAYALVLFLAASALVVLLVLAPGRARRSSAQDLDRVTHRTRAGDRDRARTRAQTRARALDPGAPEPHLLVSAPPVGERSPTATGELAAIHSPPPALHTSASAADSSPPGAHTPPVGGVGPELADLARRSQDLVDQQLELLDQVARDQADPRLPGRLLQVDRLAVRARRNAHNLIVLAGGEPGGGLEESAPLSEVVSVSVRDNPDAHRVDLEVTDDLLVPGAATDDLANLLAELVDNATSFSAPETRVRVGGQKVGSGYVVEVEDRGLGMTDEELVAVNRRLVGDPAAGDDLEQRLGTWVAGRLAARHDVRVQLRRSAYGGVTALVFLPERLVDAPPPVPPVEQEEAPDGQVEQATDAALAGLPMRRYVTQRAPTDDQALPKRAPHTSLAPDLAATGTGQPGDPASPPAARSPEQVRNMLTRYRSGLERGRAAAARDLPDDPDGDLTA